MAKNIGANISLKDNFSSTTKQFLDNLKGVKNATTSATAHIESSWSKVGKVVAGVAKGIGVGLAAGATAMAGFTVKAMALSGELEQGLGGSEAVFKEFATSLQSTAENAFTTVGLSMNDYLATANKMGALFQGSGFTIEESLNMTQSAMARAADVASIMGLDVQSAMDAVSAAAKGNFTMMDNLGVAINDTAIKTYALEKGIKTAGKTMTTQEKVGIAMQMFLERSSYAAGNYAKENETLAGALNTAKGALQNLMTGVGSADVIADAFGNLATVIGKKLSELLPSLTTSLAKVFQNLVPQIPPIIETALPGIIDGAMTLINGISDVLPSVVDTIAKVLPTLLPKLVTAFTNILSTLAEAVITNLPTILSAVGEAFSTGIATLFGEGWLPAVPIIKDVALAIGGVWAIMKVTNTAFALADGIIGGYNKVMTITKLAQEALTRAKLADKWETVQIYALYVKDAVVRGAIAVKNGVLAASQWVVTAAQWAMNAAFLASPITWIVVGVALLVGAFILLWKKSEGFRNFFINMWQAIKTGVAAFINWITPAFQAVGAFFVNLWAGIKNVFVAVWTGISIAVITIVGGIITAVKWYFNLWWTVVSTVFTAIWNTAVTVWNGISLAVSTVVNFIVTAVTTAWNWLWQTTSTVFNTIWSVISGVWNGISTAVMTVVNFIWNGITNAWTAIWTTTTTVFENIKNTIIGIFESIWNGIKTAINWIISGINKFTSGIASGINGITGVISLVPGIEIGQVSAPQIPLLASGGNIYRQGSAIVGENGPELLNLPRGASVTPLEKAGSTINNNFDIKIDGSGLSVDEILNQLVPRLKFAISNM